MIDFQQFREERKGLATAARVSPAERGVSPETWMARYGQVMELAGRTPSLPLRVDDAPMPPILVKMEGTNPTGSIKDRACAFMLRAAAADGTLAPGKILLDASSGNFACALAYYANLLHIPCSVAVSSKLTAAKRLFLSYLGATVYEIGNFTIEGNQFCRELDEREPGRYCFLDQLHNWNNPRCHYETTGPEILSQFPNLELLVGSLGSGGSLVGIAQYLREVAPQVMIVAVEASLGTRIPGVGAFSDGDYVTPFIQKARESSYFDATVAVVEAEVRCAARLAMQQGIFGGLQTGAVVHAAIQYSRKLKPSGSIVALSGDTGWKNLDKLVPPAEF